MAIDCPSVACRRPNQEHRRSPARPLTQPTYIVNDRDGALTAAQGGLADVDRPQIGVPAHSDAPVDVALPVLSGTRTPVRVQSAAVWRRDSTGGLHACHESSDGIRASPRGAVRDLLRRHHHHGRVASDVSATHDIAATATGDAQVSDQHEQVTVRASTDDSSSRYAD
jgi:hypothetical protein